MRLLYSFRFQQIGDTWLASAEGQNAHLFNGVLQLNEVGHFIVSELAEIAGKSEKPGQSGESGQSGEFGEPGNSGNFRKFGQVEASDCCDLSEQEVVSRLTDRLTNEYAVDRSTAQSAVQNVLDYLKAEQVIAN